MRSSDWLVINGDALLERRHHPDAGDVSLVREIVVCPDLQTEVLEESGAPEGEQGGIANAPAPRAECALWKVVMRRLIAEKIDVRGTADGILMVHLARDAVETVEASIGQK